jgi:hypothetical protein
MSNHSAGTRMLVTESRHSLLITHYSFSIVDVILHPFRRACLNKNGTEFLLTCKNKNAKEQS